MSNIIISKDISVEEKLSLMREDAVFDIADQCQQLNDLIFDCERT